jgi:hypothetical protein
VSGLSSGGFFAHQFHVAHSALVTGAGIVAGGPYGCVETIANPHWPHPPLDWFSAALVACTHYSGDRFWGLRPAPPRAEDSLAHVLEARRRGAIDDPANLADDRVWLFRGREDEIVPGAVAATLKALYEALGRTRGAVARRAERPAAPGQPWHAGRQVPRRQQVPEEGLLGAPGRPSSSNAAATPPNRCSGTSIRRASTTRRRTRTPRAPWPPSTRPSSSTAATAAAGLSGVGYLYVPAACQGGGCRLHVAFHGCRQNVDARGADRAHDDFVRDAGYNRWAAANRIVVLYPQATESALNPNRCWDFWGYTGPTTAPGRAADARREEHGRPPARHPELAEAGRFGRPLAWRRDGRKVRCRPHSNRAYPQTRDSLHDRIIDLQAALQNRCNVFGSTLSVVRCFEIGGALS